MLKILRWLVHITGFHLTVNTKRSNHSTHRCKFFKLWWNSFLFWPVDGSPKLNLHFRRAEGCRCPLPRFLRGVNATHDRREFFKIHFSATATLLTANDPSPGTNRLVALSFVFFNVVVKTLTCTHAVQVKCEVKTIALFL